MDTTAPPTHEAEKAFQAVASSADVKEGVLYCISVRGIKIVLTRLEGVCRALDNRCTHAGGPLCAGRMKGGFVECPWHGAQYDLVSGKAVKLPARLEVHTYTVREREGNVEIEL